MTDKPQEIGERYEQFLTLTNSEGKTISSVVIHPTLWCCGNYDTWVPCVTKRDKYTQLKSVFRAMRTPPELRVLQSEIDAKLTVMNMERCEKHRNVDECIKQDVLTICLQNQKALLAEDGKLKNPRIKAAFKGRAQKVITARYKQDTASTLAEREFEYDFGVTIPENLSKCYTLYTANRNEVRKIRTMISETAEHKQKMKEHKCEPLVFPDGEDQIPGNKLIFNLSGELLNEKSLFRCFTKEILDLPPPVGVGKREEETIVNPPLTDSAKITDSDNKEDGQNIIDPPRI